MTQMILPWRNTEIERIRELALYMEEKGSIHTGFINWIVERKLFKLFVPEQLGGLMASLPQAAEVFEEAAWIDGSFGWTVTIGAGGGFFVPFLPPKAAQALFSPDKAVIAGSGMPTGTAKQVEGGYIVDGTWKYCSGSRHATFFTANAVIQDGGSSSPGDAPNVRSFAFLPEQVRVMNDWNAFGLRATDSHTISVHAAFVPNERTFSIMEPHAEFQHRLYDYPFGAFAAISFAAVTLGIGRHFLDEAEGMLNQHRDAWETARPGRAAFMEYLINEGRCAYTEAKRHYKFHVECSWNELMEKGSVSQQMENECVLQSKSAAQAMRSMADSIFPYLGMGAIMQNSRINQIWRDLHTACQHSSLVSFQP